MSSQKALLTLALAGLLSGCSSMSGYRPTVDTKFDPRAQFLEQDMVECEALASQAAGTVKEIAMGTGVGALGGAAAGAAIGAVVGNPATGAALGSVAGIGGGLYSGVQADSRYRIAFQSCLRQRGHQVIGMNGAEQIG